MKERKHRIARRVKRVERGLGLIEVLIAVATGAIALLAHAAGVLRTHHLTKAEQTRTLAVQTVRSMVERLRDDDDWITLQSRLSALLDVTGGWHPISDLYGDIPVPEALGKTQMRIEIPRSPAVDSVLLPGLHLREDVPDAMFGLPFDLNGDGVIKPDPVEANYVILPVIVRLRWEAHGEVRQEMRVSTWLTGERR